MWFSAVGFIVTLTLSLLVAPLAAEAQRRRKCTGSVLHPGLPSLSPIPLGGISAGTA